MYKIDCVFRETFTRKGYKIVIIYVYIEDEQFLEEKKILITTLKDLEKSDIKPTA